jgi:two-component system capsular synthesis sensor histidine kinase RcsC
LINDVLDLSKIEAEHLTLHCEPVDVIEVLQECIELARPLVQSDAVELRLEAQSLGADIGPWIGDELRFRQIITNLIGNAAKFTEAGYIQVRVRVEDWNLVVEVEDSGVGIAASDQSRIFHDFEQVDSSNTRRAGGTGLGLAISERLSRLMGGSISVRSVPGVGTCFTVRLPMVEEAVAGDGRPRPEEIARGSG